MLNVIEAVPLGAPPPMLRGQVCVGSRVELLPWAPNNAGPLYLCILLRTLADKLYTCNVRDSVRCTPYFVMHTPYADRQDHGDGHLWHGNGDCRSTGNPSLWIVLQRSWADIPQYIVCTYYEPGPCLRRPHPCSRTLNLYSTDICQSCGMD